MYEINKTFGIYTLCSDVASLVGHVLLCGLYMQHYTCANTNCILYKIPKDNVGNAYSIYNYEHELFWHLIHKDKSYK